LIEFKYNEEKYAEVLLEKGFQTKYFNYELRILAKYYKYKGHKAKKRKELLYEFCEKFIPNFNKVKYFTKINSALRHGSKRDNQLLIINEIPITDEEVEYINGLEIDCMYKKVLFTLLVQNKIKKEICTLTYGKASEFNYFGGKNQKYQEIQQISKISSKYKINSIINYLDEKQLIEIRTRGKVNLLFIDKIPISDNVVMNITTFDNIGYYLDWYNGDKKISSCIDCGKLIYAINNKIKYCKTCSKKHKKQQDRIADKKYKSKISEKIENVE
jgi:hypothetical protein